MKILITGSKGQLGTELVGILKRGRSEIGEIPEVFAGAKVVGVDIDTLDLADVRAVQGFDELHADKLDAPFDLIINCAAMTNVDACETDPEAAMRGNALAVRNVAFLASMQEAALLHISTDYVFSGRSDRPYSEWDLPAPETAYGKSKLLGERYARETWPHTFIVRTSWLYGRHGGNFVKTILGLAKEREEIKVVSDQVGNPTNANDLAHHILKIAAGEDFGVYHVTGGGICSWHEFAAEIVRLSGISCKVLPCTTEEFPRPAPRPAYSAMDHLMLRATVGDEMRHWKEALAAYFAG